MCCFYFFYGSKHGYLGISAAQQPILHKTDVARVGMETKKPWLACSYFLKLVLALCAQHFFLSAFENTSF